MATPPSSAPAAEPEATGKPSLRATRLILLLGTVMALVAGTQLFVGTEHTDTYFAWTIDPPLTAASLGANYVAALLLLGLSARERLWERARIGVHGGLVLTTLVLVATLVHLERFHLDDERFLTQLGAWAFVLTYVVLPVLFLASLVLQRRAPGGEGARVAHMPRWFRVALGLQGSAMLLFGAALVAAPGDAAHALPWTLTPLTGRAIGAWAVALGFAALLVVLRENDWLRARIALASYAVLGALQLVALARYRGTPDWDAAETWVYVAFVLSVVALGGYGAWAAYASAPRPAAAPAAAR